MLQLKASRLTGSLSSLGPWQILLFGSWLLAMITLPIAKWTWGIVALEWGVVLNVVLQTGLITVILAGAWGISKTIRAAGTIVVLTLGAEAIGTATGFPFGQYHYTAKLQPQIAHVPLLIPFAWFMMLPVAWAVAYKLVGKASGWRFVAVSAAAMTAWDLFLDPQMVAWGFWVWDQPGGYFGIPWQNFAGWFLTAALVTVAVRPAPLSHGLLPAVYGAVWFLETVGLLFFWALPGPALVGSIAMGSLIILLWRAEQRSCV